MRTLESGQESLGRVEPRRAVRLLAAAAFMVCLACPPALAHKVNVYAVAEGGLVRGEGWFAGGGKAQGAPVELVDARGAVLAKGLTGKDGGFVLALPKDAAAPLRVVLKAGDGHQNDFSLSAADLGLAVAAPQAEGKGSGASATGTGGLVRSADDTASPAQADQATRRGPASTASGPDASPATESISGMQAPLPAPSAASASVPGHMASAPTAAPLDEARLAALVEAATAKALEEKLAPMKAQLARLSAESGSPGAREVIGGLGWIVGLIGLAAWFKRPGASRRD